MKDSFEPQLFADTLHMARLYDISQLSGMFFILFYYFFGCGGHFRSLFKNYPSSLLFGFKIFKFCINFIKINFWRLQSTWTVKIILFMIYMYKAHTIEFLKKMVGQIFVNVAVFFEYFIFIFLHIYKMGSPLYTDPQSAHKLSIWYQKWLTRNIVYMYT